MISLISPSRNNLKYLKWSYASVRKNAPASVEYCVADDFSNDGTWEWCQEMMKVDPNFKAIRNEGPTRLGHTILYDTLINEVATQPIVGIWHADMYMTPRTVEKIVDTVKPQVVVSLTRIEPPLHPPGPEKVVMDFKTEPEDFNEESFLQWYENDYQPSVEHKTTQGIFAPWFLLKQDFQSVGGHDPLYAPQSKEDSDIFNRFLLAQYSFVQVWDAAIYHMTCRGSRFNPTLTTPGTNSQEWETQNMISTRNFIRKWGHFVKHDQFLMPQVPPKFNIAFEVKNCDFQYIIALEPWCDLLVVGNDKKEDVEKYVEIEQVRAKSFDLSKRVVYTDDRPHTDVTVHFDTKDLNQERFQLLTQLPEILAQNTDTGTFELDIFKIEVNKVETYEHRLINLKTIYN
jgi:glycosyltransferase involved in cell wall biosynthesis